MSSPGPASSRVARRMATPKAASAKRGAGLRRALYEAFGVRDEPLGSLRRACRFQDQGAWHGQASLQVPLASGLPADNSASSENPSRRCGLTAASSTACLRHAGCPGGVQPECRRAGGLSLVVPGGTIRRIHFIDASHFKWEEAADEHAALATSWWAGGYAAVGPAPGLAGAGWSSAEGLAHG
jgi:hypothetical protein